MIDPELIISLYANMEFEKDEIEIGMNGEPYYNKRKDFV